MSEFDSIRPFHDHEVPEVVARVVNDPDLPKAAARFIMPPLLHDSELGVWLTRWLLKLRGGRLHSVHDCQMFTKVFLERLIADSITDLTVSGLEHLDSRQRYLFISNHRDIVMDSTLLNYVIFKAGHETCRSAVGDNLLTNALAADLMRLNKSFVVQRAVSGAKATLKVLHNTSQYIRHSLQENVSVWIAQRQGRAKDGMDHTDPTLLKMLALAYKEEADPLNAVFAHSRIVPVSISYEIDPCAVRKAHELRILDEVGQYDKGDQEDVQSIVMGVVGHKGRVHLHFSPQIQGSFETPEQAAADIDRAIMGSMRMFPTHVAAAERLHGAAVGSADVPQIAEIMARFEAQLDSCVAEEQPFLLMQYANQLRNRLQVENGNGTAISS